MSYTLDIQELADTANQDNINPKDAQKLLIAAIQLADENLDTLLGYELRLNLLNKQWGLADKPYFVNAFSWMLNAYDENPKNYSVNTLLWRYKWVIGELFSNPDVPLAQIQLVLEDYKRRAVEQGFNLRSYYTKQLHDALNQKDSAASRKYLDLVNALPTDGISDCRACEVDNEVSFLINEGDFKEAFSRAQPLLQKQYSCAHVPLITLCNLCYMAIKDHRIKEAADLFMEAEQELLGKESDSTLITSMGMLIVYLFHTDKTTGWNYAERYLPWALECEANKKFFFSMHLAEALKLEDQENIVRLKLPDAHPLYKASDTYAVKDLYDFYYQQAIDYAYRFDKRNGNSNFSIQAEDAKI
ncbi:hypothetical protein TH53_15540 [Pedobacter lusitanus]|uniref:Contig65, whole genome shotgun sequence n=1 Tax=Pedobacter lusitanus TaxID=1503925 RepID=A0A0D0GJS2_9SPHI|nr:hypothetical protein [Pedobacter lusitanus]KIO76360.1 hypothetical protein TH53_15540 [Pedobacter lusitanus]